MVSNIQMKILEKTILPQLADTFYLGVEECQEKGLSSSNVTNWMIQEVVSQLDVSTKEATKIVADTMIAMGCWE